MKKQNEREHERLDPESEACLSALTACIVEELSAQIAIGDDPSPPEGRQNLSVLIADAILDGFVVRQRISPRYRWNRTAP